MDDVTGGQTIPCGNAGVSSRAPTELAAFFQELRTRRAMDGAVHASAAEQCRIRRIDDRIDLQRDDIDLLRFKLVLDRHFF
jgi:hypothetical protein